MSPVCWCRLEIRSLYVSAVPGLPISGPVTKTVSTKPLPARSYLFSESYGWELPRRDGGRIDAGAVGRQRPDSGFSGPRR